MEGGVMGEIELLVPTLGNSPNEHVRIITRDDTHLYYYDGLDRWCCLPMSEEGIAFVYVSKEERPWKGD